MRPRKIGTRTSASVYLDNALYARLQRICDQKLNPYAPVRQNVLHRGIELAVTEFEAIEKQKRGRK